MRALVIFGLTTLTKSYVATKFGNPFKNLIRDNFPGLATLYVRGDEHKPDVTNNPDGDYPNYTEVRVDSGYQSPPSMISIEMNNANPSLPWRFLIDDRGGPYASSGLTCPSGPKVITWT